MSSRNFSEVLDHILQEDKRYEKGAYYFLRYALDHTIKKNAKKRKSEKQQHIRGQELLDGIREYALEQYGPMTKTVLNEWGLHSSEDFGEIVFNLVDYGVLGKTEEDSRDDFKEGFDFDEAFVTPFQPSHPPPE